MVTEKLTYVTSDNTEFPTLAEAQRYEQDQSAMTSPQARKFLKGYRGAVLLKHHSLEEYGTWEVLGEDPNCDLGGAHHMPRLGIFTGTLKDIINKAVTLPEFWCWGSGGNIIELKVNSLT